MPPYCAYGTVLAMMRERALAAEVVADIVGIGRFAASRGWVPATSGNFSRRIDDSTVAITRSGVDKGALTEREIAVISLDEPLPIGVSAETPLHVARYQADSTVGAILHVHTLAATVLSQMDQASGAITIEGYEMQKALAGVTTHEGSIRLPVFANAQDTGSLAERIESALGDETSLPGYVLAGHGLYAWGATMADAKRHLEGLEFLLQCVFEERRFRA